jgi:hypothetical protein
MVPAQKQLPLSEAFRVVLRNCYPRRPALADEIQSHAWFTYAPKISGTQEPTAEAKVAVVARSALLTAIREQRLQLRGSLSKNVPADIDPIEAARANVYIFECVLKVYDHNTPLRIYSNVHCYDEDVRALLSRPRSRRGRRPGADWDAVGILLREEIKKRGMPTIDNDDPDWRTQADVEGWVAEVLDQRGESKVESTVREHVSQILKEIEAGN